MPIPTIIIRSVGRNGFNDEYDVRVVQRLLNNAFTGHGSFNVTGLFDKPTQQAIEYFQQNYEGAQRPSGNIVPGGSTMRRLQAYAGTYYSIKDKSVILGDGVERVIDAIATRFYCNSGRRIVVTSGIRTPNTQAKALHTKLKLGDDVLKLYGYGANIKNIVNAHDKSVKAGNTEEQTIKAMEDEITAQVKAGKFISAHLYSKAFDVRSTDMEGRVKRLFKRVAQPCVKSFIEENKPPHFHMQAH
ncbi:MAG: peptidoglycan-binding domain-containing protein [Flavobacteriales bacterium]